MYASERSANSNDFMSAVKRLAAFFLLFLIAEYFSYKNTLNLIAASHFHPGQQPLKQQKTH
jgi:hypothetical protein